MKPELRYRGYKDDWTRCSLKDYLIEHKGGAPLQPKDFTDEAGFEVIPKKSITANGWLNMNKISPTYCTKDFFEKYPRSVINNEYLVTTLRDLVPSGPTIGYIVKFDSNNSYLLAQGVYGFKIKSNELAPDFLIQLSNTSKYRKMMKKLMVGSTQVHIRNEDFFSMPIELPQYEEQQKIADFLFALDKKISLLKERHALLEQYKKGVMKKLFSKEIRFKDENGNDFPDWANTKFDKVFERVTQKNKENNLNVLTISAQRGLINQEKYFNKSVSAKDVTGYYLLNGGDFAYNKSYSKGYPMGAIKRLNNYAKGVVSTLYICFKSHGNQHDAFWEQYFEAGLLNREISKIAQEGARNHGLLNVSVTEFFRDIIVHEPSEKEQVRIAEFLGTLDKKLKLVSQQIKLTQTFKKGLLQQMFV